MDVYVQRPGWPTINSGSAHPWDQCFLDSADARAKFTSLVTPYFIKLAEQARTRKRYDSAPWTSYYNPDFNNLGVMMVGSGDIPPNATYEFEEIRKSKTSAKEWRAEKKSGAVVLRPMRALKYSAFATPGFTSATKNTVSMTVNGEKLDPGFLPGICHTYYRGLDALSVDVSEMQNFRVVFDRFVNASVIPPSRQQCIDAVSLVRDSFISVPVNSGLVTNTVADANSQTFDIATEIAELPETIKFIVNGVIAGIRLLLRMKKDIKQQLSSGSVKTDMASIWMMYRYALMPIVYSVNDGLDLLSLEAKSYQSFRGRSDSPCDLPDLDDFKYTGNSQYIERCFVKYGYDLNSKVTGLKINIASTAWELIPLSFVFDWFIQVGDTLTALGVPHNVQHSGVSYSVRDDNRHTWFNQETGATIVVVSDSYRTSPINPQSHIGFNSEVFVGFKRKMDALALFWLIFKKDSRG